MQVARVLAAHAQVDISRHGQANIADNNSMVLLAQDLVLKKAIKMVRRR
jgi:hypothetical protein